ncbi:Iron-sulfur cluster repair protein ScdA [Sporotomaculum syntrophicum]|uniref:Iron-sulfur cluster repair protein ScdA n=1 Tax=Sporotomaculum syntrophicum TaxID=182264 RepID=A0A9D3AWW8_9FIRM|nr:iron-sulfur cluster repair di-iron protein, ric [Sporotomaculum syntrophicum]KAF1083741.1 Iron-sulfur cluster repair protein ScdA [Sporotomaculum syntrophicum]
MSKQLFNQAKERHFEKLEQYVPIVARVHGDNHPEFHEVHKVFNTIIKKAKEAGAEMPELNEEFIELRKITDNYKVPGDVCEAYEGVYNMLAEVDKAYQDK